MENKINYRDLMELGFLKNSSKDQVWEDIHGYPYFFLTYNINDTLLMDWVPSRRTVRLLKIAEDSNMIIKEKDNLTLKEVKDILEWTR